MSDEQARKRSALDRSRDLYFVDALREFLGLLPLHDQAQRLRRAKEHAFVDRVLRR